MFNPPIIVLYHHPCSDGMAAALAAYLKLGDSATYIGCTYKDRPEIPDGATVYFVDYSWPKAELLALGERCAVIVIDHHESAMKDLTDIPNNCVDGIMGAQPALLPSTTGLFLYCDMSRSGAVLAWTYFHRHSPLPRMFEFIEDRDLWKWELVGSKDFSYYLRAQELTLETYEAIYRISKNRAALDRMLDDGNLLRQADERTVQLLLNYAHPGQFVEGPAFMAVNSIVLPSELGEALLAKYPDIEFAAVYYITEDGKVKWSLRSRKGGYDVGSLAKRMGGGGHYNAAGFYSQAPTVEPAPLIEHYKGGVYRLLAENVKMASDAKEGDTINVYQSIDPGKVIYGRETDNFNGPAIVGEFPGRPVPRFQRV